MVVSDLSFSKREGEEEEEEAEEEKEEKSLPLRDSTLAKLPSGN